MKSSEPTHEATDRCNLFGEGYRSSPLAPWFAPGWRATQCAVFRAEAQAWVADDPDPETRAEVERWLATDDEVALREAFHRRASFGTSGIRGPLGPGTSRVNRRLARQVAAGLARHVGPGATVVVGRDGRHLSPELAHDAAAVLAGAGVHALTLPGTVPTPLLAFAVRHLGCAAGVMVTASHNPPGDNGLKVFADDGGQLLPPTDGTIAAAIDDVTGVRSLPLGQPAPLGDDVLDAYLDAAAARVPPGPRDIRVVHTALHGVAGAPLAQLFTRSGLPAPIAVGSQAAPDPNFPTVRSPNPEEPEALELAIGEAARHHADLVLATDPDGDRLAVAVPEGARWRRLTGDEIGVLLAEQALTTTSGPGRVVASSLASSRMLGALAAEAGAEWVTTLPGFKWVARAADGRPGAHFVFGYEEALGYAVHDLVRDKDALTAAAAFAVLVAEMQDAGESVGSRLDALERRHGVHATRRWSLPLPGAAGVPRMQRAIDHFIESPPRIVGGLRVQAITRVAADLLVLELDGDARVVVRPSGTEPRLKAYVEAIEPVDTSLDRARAGARDRAERLRTSLAALLTEAASEL
jgi:phosphomannomutase